MNAREGALTVALLTAVGGLALAFAPGLAASLGVPSDAPFVLGAIAVLAGVYRVRTWLGHEERDFTPAERERPTGIGTPGAEFDRTLARAPERPTRGGNTRRIMLRQSLREAAIDVLVTYRGHTEESARRALDRGTWSDDRHAVEFFTTVEGTGGSLSESVTATFTDETPFERRADRAAREIDRLAGREQ